MINKKTMKKEAIKRMKELELMSECVEAFEKQNEIWMSTADGLLCNLKMYPEIVKIIKDFENKYHSLVYHCIKNYVGNMTLITIFYVFNDKEEWEEDIDYIKQNYSFCYVFNITEPIFSEFGFIEFAKANGGLKRTS